MNRHQSSAPGPAMVCPQVPFSPASIFGQSWLPLVAVVWLLAGNFTFAAGWPQFLGPARNGHYDGPKLSESWPKEGPPILWKKPVGEGFAGPVVSDGKLILFHRVKDEEVAACLDAENGKEVWQFAYPTHYRDDFGFEEGPRATPSVAAGRVYTYGAEGMLHCLEFATGKKLWAVDTRSAYGAGKGFFGIACSPLVEGNGVLLNIGGQSGAGIVAFDQATGKLLWKATDDEASYSSPVAADLNGQRRVVFFTRAGLVIVDPKNGTVHEQFPWRARMNASVNAATPLVIGNEIFLSASYQTGAILLRLPEGRVEKVWSGDDILSNHYATSVYYDGYLYGYEGRQEYGPSLRCVEFKTGKVRWTKESFGAGTVTLAGDRLVLMKEDGQLVLAAADPAGFKTIASAQILSSGTRPYPAFADGRCYARSKTTLLCVDLRPHP